MYSLMFVFFFFNKRRWLLKEGMCVCFCVCGVVVKKKKCSALILSFNYKEIISAKLSLSWSVWIFGTFCFFFYQVWFYGVFCQQTHYSSVLYLHVLLSLGKPLVKWLAKVFKIKHTCTNTSPAPSILLPRNRKGLSQQWEVSMRCKKGKQMM